MPRDIGQYHTQITQFVDELCRVYYKHSQPEDRRDINSEIALIAHQNREQVTDESETAFLAWLREIAKNVIRNWSRRQGTVARHALGSLEDENFTDDVFAKIDWYVNDVRKTTTNGGGDERKTASFSNLFAGNGYGKNYTIKAVAYSEDGDTDSESYGINVRKAVVDYGGGSGNDMGYVEVTKCEWNGNTAYGEMFTHVENESGKTVGAVSVFNYWVLQMRPRNDGDVVVRDRSPAQPPVEDYDVNDGECTCQYHSDSYTITGKGWWMEDDYLKLAIRASVGVKGGSSWNASGTACYYLPTPE